MKIDLSAQQTFILANGEVIDLPFYQALPRWLFLFGTINLGKASDILAREGLVPYKHGAFGYAAIGGLEVSEGSLGPYKQIIVSIFAQFPDATPNGLIARFLPFMAGSKFHLPYGKISRINHGALDIGQISWKVSVDSEIAMDAGRKLFGVPKVLENIDIVDQEDSLSFRSQTFFIKCAQKGFIHMPFSAVTTGNLFGTKEFRSCVTPLCFIGKTAFKLFNQKCDQVYESPTGLYDNCLRQLEFSPKLWIKMVDAKLIDSPPIDFSAIKHT